MHFTALSGLGLVVHLLQITIPCICELQKESFLKIGQILSAQTYWDTHCKGGAVRACLIKVEEVLYVCMSVCEVQYTVVRKSLVSIYVHRSLSLVRRIKCVAAPVLIYLQNNQGELEYQHSIPQWLLHLVESFLHKARACPLKKPSRVPQASRLLILTDS